MNMRYDDFMKPALTTNDNFTREQLRRIPDYTAHLNSRMEAAARTRQNFENKMQPTIHVQLQVRKIVALTYEGARMMAYKALSENEETYAVLIRLNAVVIVQFVDMARVAKETDGTYTVTLP